MKEKRQAPPPGIIKQLTIDNMPSPIKVEWHYDQAQLQFYCAMCAEVFAMMSRRRIDSELLEVANDHLAWHDSKYAPQFGEI